MNASSSTGEEAPISPEEFERDMSRWTKRRACHRRSKTVVFEKICKGMYVSHVWDMWLNHELIWDASVGRKWELTWSESYLGLMAPTKRSKKFDTMAEAREHANEIAARSRR